MTFPGKKQASIFLGASVAVLMCFGASVAQKVHNEEGGIVVIEAESTESTLGSWGRVTTPAGFTGTCGLQMNGNAPAGGSANSPLTYKFKVTNAGTYRMAIRAHKNLQGAAGDLCNDCYWRVEGDYVQGGTAPLANLKKDAKLYCYGKTPTTWDWSATFDKIGGTVAYNFKAEQTYTVVISGRSQRYNFDRFIFYSKDSAKAADPTTPESPTGPVAEPTCNDGKMNGTETGIDCGGSCPTTCPVVVPTCTDKIKNGDETGVDCGGSCPACQVITNCTQSYTYMANKDFTLVPAAGNYGAFYVDGTRLGIQPMTYNLKWARAEKTFAGVDCTYDLKLTSLGELDGECSYKIFVNDVQVGTVMVNARIWPNLQPDYTPQVHVVEGVTLKNGDKIRVEAIVASNEKIPEKNPLNTGFAWARARWTQLEIVPGKVAVVLPVSAQKTVFASAISLVNGNLTFAAPSAGNYTVSLFSVSGKLLSSHAVTAAGNGRMTVSLAGSNLKGTFVVAVKGMGYSVKSRIVM